MFENWQGINPMGLSSPWANYKNKQLSTNMKLNEQPYDITKKTKGLTQWVLVPLGQTIKKNIIHKHENVTNNPMM